MYRIIFENYQINVLYFDKSSNLIGIFLK